MSKSRAVLNRVGPSEESSDEVGAPKKDAKEVESVSENAKVSELDKGELSEVGSEVEPAKVAELEKEELPKVGSEVDPAKAAELEKEELPEVGSEVDPAKAAELEKEELPEVGNEVDPAKVDELNEEILPETKELQAELNKTEAINEKDRAIEMEDQLLSEVKAEFQQELAKYSKVQRVLTKEKVIIDRLSKEIQETKIENEKFITKLKMELSGRDLEVVALKQTIKEMMEESKNIQRTHKRIRQKFQTGILNEVKEFLDQKLNLIEQTEPEIEKQMRPLENKIEELQTLIQQKDIQIGLHLKEMGKLKAKLTRLNNTYGRMKKVYDRVIQQNKELRKELQKRMEFNEILKKELDKINEELSQ
ncbi:MAG: hypothetical protein HWN65_08265 [Candidatus Helarchaeota archaeon]|nr:hypothetical protein [Candidatus Helarchaeota archaeon]